MKQTAVEWLANEFYEKLEVKGDGALFNDLVNQAKEMEKQQIINAVDKTNSKWKSQKAEIILTGNQYYNKTFKKEIK